MADDIDPGTAAVLAALEGFRREMFAGFEAMAACREAIFEKMGARLDVGFDRVGKRFDKVDQKLDAIVAELQAQRR